MVVLLLQSHQTRTAISRRYPTALKPTTKSSYSQHVRYPPWRRDLRQSGGGEQKRENNPEQQLGVKLPRCLGRLVRRRGLGGTGLRRASWIACRKRRAKPPTRPLYSRQPVASARPDAEARVATSGRA